MKLYDFGILIALLALLFIGHNVFDG